jgi:hypothetical protein
MRMATTMIGESMMRVRMVGLRRGGEDQVEHDEDAQDREREVAHADGSGCLFDA